MKKFIVIFFVLYSVVGTSQQAINIIQMASPETPFGQKYLKDRYFTMKQDSSIYQNLVEVTAFQNMDYLLANASRYRRIGYIISTESDTDSTWTSITLGRAINGGDGTINFVSSDGYTGAIIFERGAILRFTGALGDYSFDGNLGTEGHYLAGKTKDRYSRMDSVSVTTDSVKACHIKINLDSISGSGDNLGLDSEGNVIRVSGIGGDYSPWDTASYPIADSCYAWYGGSVCMVGINCNDAELLCGIPPDSITYKSNRRVIIKQKDPTGFVGLGTATPASTLDVKGTISAVNDNPDFGITVSGVSNLIGGGTGVYGYSETGTGVHGNSAQAGVGVRAESYMGLPLFVERNDENWVGQTEVAKFVRNVNSGNSVINSGLYISYYTDGGLYGITETARFYVKSTDINWRHPSSSIELWTKKGGVMGKKLELDSNGYLNLPNWKTRVTTPTYLLTDSAGWIMRTPYTSGGSPDSAWNSISVGSDTENANGTITFIADNGKSGSLYIDSNRFLNFSNFLGLNINQPIFLNEINSTQSYLPSYNMLVTDTVTKEVIRVPYSAPPDLDTTHWNDSYKMWEYTRRFGFAYPENVSLRFSDIDTTLNIIVTGDSTVYLWKGQIAYMGSQNITFPSNNGTPRNFYFYLDGNDGHVKCTTSGWTLKSDDNKVPVAVVKWNKNAPGGFSYFLVNELHTCRIDRADHYMHHSTIGTRYQSGGALSGYSVSPTTASSVGNNFKVAEAEIDDEDIDVIIPVRGKPNTTSHSWIKFYRTHSSTWTWDTTAVPYPYAAGGYIQWDNNGSMTASSNNKYVNSYLLFTNMQDSARFIIVPGRGEYSTLSAAQGEDIKTFSWTGFDIAESVVMYQLTWQTSVSFSGALGKVRLAAEPKVINQSISSVSTASTTLQWTTVGNDIINANSGNVIINSPINNWVDVSGTYASGNSFTFTGTSKDLTRWQKSLFRCLSKPDTVTVTTATDYITYDRAVGTGIGKTLKIGDAVKFMPTGTLPSADPAITTDRFYYVCAINGNTDIKLSENASYLTPIDFSGAGTNVSLSCLKVGYVDSLTISTTTVTAIIQGDTILRASVTPDQNFELSRDKVYDFQQYIQTGVPEVYADASNSQGIRILDLKSAHYLLPVNSAVEIAGVGAGAFTWNVYSGSTALFTVTIPDIGTNSVLRNQVPNIKFLAKSSNVSMRILSAANATSKAKFLQLQLFLVPVHKYTMQ